MRIKYLLFRDAQHLKTRSEPNEMIADVKIIEPEDVVDLPYIDSTLEEMTAYQNSIAAIQQAWEKTQPYLVETSAGVREERFMIDGELKPRPQLESPNT